MGLTSMSIVKFRSDFATNLIKFLNSTLIGHALVYNFMHLGITLCFVCTHLVSINFVVLINFDVL